jgi:hypothetical protein
MQSPELHREGARHELRARQSLAHDLMAEEAVPELERRERHTGVVVLSLVVLLLHLQRPDEPHLALWTADQAGQQNKRLQMFIHRADTAEPIVIIPLLEHGSLHTAPGHLMCNASCDAKGSIAAPPRCVRG